MTRPLFLFIFLFSFSFYGNAQLDTVKVKRDSQHEFAFNATFFIQQFLSFGSNTNFGVSPYAISYKFISPNKSVLRTALGFSFDFDESGSNSDLTSSSISVDARVGYGKQISIAKKWLFNTGVDAVYQNDQITVSTDGPFGKIKTINATNGIGIAPHFGVQVNFTERIGLFTESSFLFIQFIDREEVRAPSEPDLNIKETNNSGRISFILPTSLFFAVRF